MRATTTTIALLALLALLGAASPAGAASHGFDLGFQDPLEQAFEDPDRPHALETARAHGAKVIRLPVAWSTIARTRPENPADPKDPAYYWAHFDNLIGNIQRRGMEPLLYLYAAPQWAQPERDGKRELTPEPDTFRDFAAAIARHYDGSEHPRVRLWQIWNEPNMSVYASMDRAAERYRALVNAASGPIHEAAPGNIVVAGGLAPFGGEEPKRISPLVFMRRMLCMSGGRVPRPTCSERSTFDVWAAHPYTAGGPNHQATDKNDVSIGDLPEVRRVARAAHRAGNLRSPGPPRLWVTEFSWDTNPPDPWGVPLDKHARWVGEGLYRMWTHGVDLMVWFQLRDMPGNNWDMWQGGIFSRDRPLFAESTPKPAAQVLRFPFAAVAASRRRTVVWGRTPDGTAQSVVVEARLRGRWRRVATLRADRHGIFRATRRGLRGTLVRARVGDVTALPFLAVPTRDEPVHLFGGPSP